MIIFRTSENTILQVVKHKKYALMGTPARLAPGESILLSLVGSREISFRMELVRIRLDRHNETDTIFGRHWPVILDCRDCLPLRAPFVMSDHAVSGHNYGPGGTSVYVQREDQEVIRARGLLETRTWAEYFGA